MQPVGIDDGIALLGLVCVVAGVYFVSLPAALVVLGVGLVAFALWCL